MILLLTSSPCDDDVPEGVDLPCIFFERNGFADLLREYVQPGMTGLYIAADPSSAYGNDEAAQTFANCFAYAGMPLSEMNVLDARTADDKQALVRGADVIILGGGHVPTQNAWFEEIRLREMLTCFDGLVMGISAGSMNCADTVYAQPEEAGEAIDPDYVKFLPGLGLTDINILPHYQKVKDNILDGLRLFEDVTYPDSEGYAFFVLPDASFILVSGEEEVLFGEGYLLADGILTQIGEDEGETDLNELHFPDGPEDL